MAAPTLQQPIPPQTVNELSGLGPINLTDYFSHTDPDVKLRFTVEALPKGIICTEDGLLTGIPAKETAGHYEIVLTVASGEDVIQTTFSLTVMPGSATDENMLDQLTSQVQQALGQTMSPPDLSNLYSGAISVTDVYYMLERWSTLVIWNADDLSPASKPTPLDLPEVGEHYRIYDRGSSIVSAPIDLFSHNRTLADALQSARILAREAYKREWRIEFAGFDKMVRAAWVEFQHLEDQYGRKMQILNYDPGIKELRIYAEQQQQALLNRAGLNE